METFPKSTGSPLIVWDEDNQQYILAGTLLGMGFDCWEDTLIRFEESTDGIWNKVSSHVHWIHEKIWEKGEKLCEKKSNKSVDST